MHPTERVSINYWGSFVLYRRKNETFFRIKITPADYRNGKWQRDLYTFFHSLALFDNKAGFNLLELCLYSIKEHDASYPSDWLVLASEMGYPKDVLKTDLQRHHNFHKNYRWRHLWHAIKNIFKK